MAQEVPVGEYVSFKLPGGLRGTEFDLIPADNATVAPTEPPKYYMELALVWDQTPGDVRIQITDKGTQEILYRINGAEDGPSQVSVTRREPKVHKYYPDISGYDGVRIEIFDEFDDGLCFGEPCGSITINNRRGTIFHNDGHFFGYLALDIPAVALEW